MAGLVGIDERFALDKVLHDEDTYRLVIAMFRKAFLDMQHDPEFIKNHRAYNVFYGDSSKIRSEGPKEHKPRATLNFSDLQREAATDDPVHVPEPDYNDPDSHFGLIGHTFLWGTSPQYVSPC